MPEPTVWAVYEKTENGAFICAIPEGPARMYERQGYRVAPMALVTPEALAVVEAAVRYCTPLPTDSYYAALDDRTVNGEHLRKAVQAYRAATATLAPETGAVRDDKGGA